MAQAQLCAHGWDAARTLTWARHLYEGLAEFFAAAARGARRSRRAGVSV
ncbi:hypothetical protein [Streptomyces sp. NBC_01294]|nr:hypothetical protein [Streptomyces sp. NBC_01294]WRZ60142.1 hypothetical protein OG534_28865 [Streptomyces sp. NBC_01294]